MSIRRAFGDIVDLSSVESGGCLARIVSGPADCNVCTGFVVGVFDDPNCVEWKVLEALDVHLSPTDKEFHLVSECVMRDADHFTPLNPVTSSGQCPACAGTAVVNEWQELLSGTLKAYKNLVCGCGHWHGDTGNLGEYQYLEDIDDWIAWHQIHIEQELAELEWLTPEDFLGFVLGLQKVHSSCNVDGISRDTPS
ncbi:hypothetical protein ACLPJG_26540 [Pseudomonas aeruginosa]|jgi:hypothetical protein|uniref:Uncharacterized protein n=2 Tax=Pseudomonas TaxID=286 RepID=A0ABD4YMI6_9PSED|nr:MULTISPECIES: hypothetical protein [Pseudomonas]AGZ38147.1 hypothetical protein PVLB_27052 [Pseudomonas sp. VLB120]MCF3157293.1 hypothetical protein [Pseudomonas juntendi]MDH0760480.1 hypothetical protein [Pseudomonas juntendi]MDH1917935.1 hypothetical protein [Pseudomonas juntendi]MDM3951106.1 hypothetical protein [Pseudomonas alloputida]